jgi:dienelactone hydrolase
MRDAECGHPVGFATRLAVAAGCVVSGAVGPKHRREHRAGRAVAGPVPDAARRPDVLGNAHAATTTVTTSDGVTLYAATIGHGPIGLVMAEDVPHSICEELPEAVLFAQHGYRVEVFDWRDRGSSGTSGANPGRLDRDVEAAASTLRRQGSRCVAVVGSYGGAAAAIVAAVSMHPAPVALVAFDPAALRGQYIEGPFGPEGALDAAPRVETPVLYVTLQGDRFVPVSEVRRLEHATGSPSHLVVVPAGLIGFGLLDLSPDSARVQRAVFSFLRSNARC